MRKLTIPLLLTSALLLVSASWKPVQERIRFWTNRPVHVSIPLPPEEDAFSFVMFGDRTGGPKEGVRILAEAVGEVNLIGPDLVMTVGDLIQGYNQTDLWMEEMREYRGSTSARCGTPSSTRGARSSCSTATRATPRPARRTSASPSASG
jgi:hypothetical protein